MKQLFLISCLVVTVTAQAQIGGRYAFTGAALPSNARVTALGGSVINVLDDDVALAQQNPALVDSIMHNQLSFNHNFHLAGISNGNLAYGRYLSKWGIAAHAALQYFNFGNFTRADEFGNTSGEFTAGEVGLTVGVGKQVNERIRAGVNLKLLSGSYEAYNNVGVGLDLGLHYTKDERTSWALVLRNIGTEISPIVDDRRSLPLDLQLGYSKRLEHLPFRFSIIGHNLQEPYIRYDDPEFDISTDISGNQVEVSGLSRNVDNFFRHIIFNGEFLLGKKEGFRLRFGYDHFRRRELRVSNLQSLGGFSFGFGFNIKRIKIDYGRGVYHLAGGVNHLSIRYNIGTIFNKI